MSYAWALNETSRLGLGAIEIWLQEEVLDELDRVAGNPQLLQHRNTSAVAVHDFTRRRGGMVHYVFLTLEPDARSEILRVIDIGRHSRADD